MSQRLYPKLALIGREIFHYIEGEYIRALHRLTFHCLVDKTESGKFEF